jgi:hypothetical protein
VPKGCWVYTCHFEYALAEKRLRDDRYSTQPRELNDLRILRTVTHKGIGPASAVLGAVRVTQQVTGYRRVQQFSEEVLDVEDLDLLILAARS